MENKQKAIKEAYGEHWETVKDYVDENGWIYTQTKHFNNISGLSHSNLQTTPFNSEMEYYWRPKSLQGIETNNGWIKIESEADLPKDDSVNYDMYNKNGRAISDLPLKTIIQLFEKGIITHYAIHVQRKPPIY